MAKRQTRRSISLRTEVYVRLHDFTRATRQSDSAVTEKALAEYLDRHGAPTVTREEALDRMSGRIRVAKGDDAIEEMRRRAFGG